MATKLNENSEVALPLRNIISLIAAAAVATWAYFGIVERLNKIETNITLMNTDRREYGISYKVATRGDGKSTCR